MYGFLYTPSHSYIYSYIVIYSSGVPRNFVRGGGSKVQLRTKDRENGDLGAVAP